MNRFRSNQVAPALIVAAALCCGWGCREEAPKSTPNTPVEAKKSPTGDAPADEASSLAAPTNADKADKADGPAADKGKDAKVPPTGKEAGDADPKAEVPMTPVEQILRQFFDHLAHKRLDEARAMMVLRTADCRGFMLELSGCENLITGQKEGWASLASDPVPFNSKILNLVTGSEIKTDKERGFSLVLSLWAGNVLRARTPDGHVFVMKSLAVIETPKGLRIMWGKMRSGSDSIRNPKAKPKTP